MTQERDESFLIRKESCPKCGSRDNLGVYSDGHKFCFGQGCGHYEKGEGEETHSTTPRHPRVHMSIPLIDGEFKPLAKRSLTQVTCERWRYQVGNDEGTPVQVANYVDPASGQIVAQKLRTAAKDFRWTGAPKGAPLFGQHLWRDKGKMLVVTEGEIDAMTVSQVQEHKWPVVSIQNGAGSARKSLAAQLEWLLGFDTIVLMFDDDEPGRDASAECAALFPPGRCKIARIEGFKDANEALCAGKAGAITEAIWGAREYRPDGIVTLEEVADRAATPPPRGRKWFLPELDAMTNGIHWKQLVLVGGGSGTGKTHVFLHQADQDLREGHAIALHLMEADPESSVRTLAGLRAGRNYTELSDSINPAILKGDIAKLIGPDCPSVYILDSQGANDWDSIRDRIRHLTHSNGVRIHYVDNLTTLAAGSDLDEKEAVEQIISECAGMVLELDISIMMASHLATPDGTPHEEGGRVMLRHFRGSRAVGYWGWVVVGLERNSQAEDDETRLSTCFRLLKCRPKGSSTGKTAWAKYDPDTALLIPCKAPPKPEKKGKDYGFKNEDF